MPVYPCPIILGDLKNMLGQVNRYARSTSNNQREAIHPLSAGASDAADSVTSRRNEGVPEVLSGVEAL
jgi:hypothetical protein